MKTTKDKLLTYVLTPLSWIYGACVYLRNKMFDANILKQKEFDIPVVSVGNITVGGTGKTPHVEYIVSPPFGKLQYRGAFAWLQKEDTRVHNGQQQVFPRQHRR